MARTCTDRRRWTNPHAAKSVQPDFNRFWCCRSRRSPPWAPLKHRPADRRRQCPSAPLPAAAAAAPARRRSFLARCAAKSVHRVGVRVLRLLWAGRALFGCCGCPGPAAVAPNGSAQPQLGGSTAGRAAARADAGLAASRPAATAVSCARAAVLAAFCCQLVLLLVLCARRTSSAPAEFWVWCRWTGWRGAAGCVRRCREEEHMLRHRKQAGFPAAIGRCYSVSNGAV